jgi:hypothetical protein
MFARFFVGAHCDGASSAGLGRHDAVALRWRIHSAGNGGASGFQRHRARERLASSLDGVQWRQVEPDQLRRWKNDGCGQARAITCKQAGLDVQLPHDVIAFRRTCNSREWTVLNGPRAQTVIIEPDAERQATREEARARREAESRMDWTRVVDIMLRSVGYGAWSLAAAGSGGADTLWFVNASGSFVIV